MITAPLFKAKKWSWSPDLRRDDDRSLNLTGTFFTQRKHNYSGLTRCQTYPHLLAHAAAHGLRPTHTLCPSDSKQWFTPKGEGKTDWSWCPFSWGKYGFMAIAKEFIWFSRNKVNCRDFLDFFDTTCRTDTFIGILNITERNHIKIEEGWSYKAGQISPYEIWDQSIQKEVWFLIYIALRY